MIALGEIKDLQGKMLEIEGYASKQQLFQLAASGGANREQLDALSKMYVDMSGEMSVITGKKIVEELKLPDLQEALAEKQEEQAKLMTKIDEYVKFIQEIILKEPNIAALSKTDLTDLFGEQVGSNITSMAKNMAILAYGKDVPAYALGGVVRNPTYAMIGEKGPEAVIPLAKGYVPVKIDGGSYLTKPAIINTNNTTNNIDMNITVRDNSDIEEIKKFVIKQQYSINNFTPNVNQYSDRF